MSQTPIDIDHLLSMTGGDADLADEVLGIFQEQARIWSRMLDPRAEASHWADAAHTLKGAALSVGAHDLAESCQRAERAGRENPPTPAGAALLLNEVKDELSRALEACSRVSHALSRPGLRASKASNS
ncbi:MAG: phosphotransferase [Henriciella sp.]|jgi:HPt (histidine-containing phosphotransfer) domain-containing protein|uniref:Hpt domain-containing protein n=1 Tax=Henriciella sp. TaxID=1968823 RepID=UPI000C0EF65D|nr:Hpt domain-containing protein [Henriciella sp.]MAN72929.1 phosphotransferase [Henriciella sp.]MBF33263.1 phosphotransferase [Hyphomonadaceae bacterium]MBK76018.1 phosphotransferase [Henriciella sp.]PHR78151.1 MAG: phosphotransferase [Henriciella sp.]